MLNESTVENPLANVDLDESPGAEPISEQLKAALSKNSVRIISLFKSWDNDGDGTISLEELETGLRTLGLDVPAAYIDEIYTSWDIDGNGTLTLKELATVRTQHHHEAFDEVDLDESPGAPPCRAAAEWHTRRTIHILTLFKSWDEVMLRIYRNRTRAHRATCNVIHVTLYAYADIILSRHLFALWKQDGDGMVSKSEFETGLRTVRADGSTPQVDLLIAFRSHDRSDPYRLGIFVEQLGLDVPSSAISLLFWGWDR